MQVQFQLSDHVRTKYHTFLNSELSNLSFLVFEQFLSLISNYNGEKKKDITPDGTKGLSGSGVNIDQLGINGSKMIPDPSLINVRSH